MPDAANQAEVRFVLDDLPEDDDKSVGKAPIKGIPLAVPTDAHTLTEIPNQEVEYVNGSFDSEEEEKPEVEVG
jgi:hypothetical protein